MLEYERKVMLTKEEYVFLAYQCRAMFCEPQINYYFDTDDLYMNQHGITCRIRAKNGMYKATIKNHNSEYQACSREEDIYDGAEFNSSVFETLGMHLQGKLTTIRSIMFKDAFCEIALDKSIYLGHTDFEIEIEYGKNSEEKAFSHLKRIAKSFAAANLINSPESFLCRVGKGKTKAERFFERKRMKKRDDEYK